MLIGDRTFTLLMFMLHMDMHGASSIVPHAALWHLGFDFHLSLESGACQIDSSAVSHRCIRRVQRERNMQNGMITILGDARLRSGYLPHAKRAIYQLIYIPESYDTLELQLSIKLVTTQTQLFLITITQKKMFFPGRGVA